MKMDETTKQKLLAYIAKKQSQEKSNDGGFGQEYSQFQDIIAWMASDIQSKVGTKNITIQGREKVLSGEFFLSMYKQILGEGLNIILESDGIIAADDLEVLQNSQDLNELLTKLVMLSMVDSIVAEKIIKSISAAYIAKSIEMAVMPDEYVASVVTQ